MSIAGRGIATYVPVSNRATSKLGIESVAGLCPILNSGVQGLDGSRCHHAGAILAMGSGVKIRRSLLCLLWLLLGSAEAGWANVKIPCLKVGDDVYSNVTVLSVTTTDIYFSHAGGLGNAKLKSLAPDLQKLFHYDAAKAAETAQQHATANFQYAQAVKETKRATPAPGPSGESDEIPSHEISAKSFLNQPSPPVVAEKWLTPQPTLTGKFILLDFWGTWSGPCLSAIPKLNAFQEQFKDRLVVVGLSDESEREVRNMSEPKIEYSSAIDTQHRASLAYGVQRIPHAVLVDPKGIVRFEGHPGYLDEQKLAALLDKYAQ
jgi:cytochrome c biogenesis protein CcmG, thiol:disulfide interchange protein DsbE